MATPTTPEAAGTVHIVITSDGYGWAAAFDADVAMRSAAAAVAKFDAEGVSDDPAYRSTPPEFIALAVTGNAAAIGAALDKFGLGL